MKTAAADAGAPVVADQGQVGAAAGLDAGGRGPGGEARRQDGAPLDRGAGWIGQRRQEAVGRRSRAGLRRRVAAARSSSSARRLRRQRELLEAGRLGQPVDGVEGLDRLAGGALDEVVDDADGEDPAGPLVDADVDPAGCCCPRTCFVAGGWVDHVDEGLAGVGLGVEGVELALGDGPASAGRGRRRGCRASSGRGGGGSRRRAPPGWRPARARPAVPSAGKLLLHLGDVAVAADAVRLHALVDLAEHEVLLRLAAGARDAGLGVDDEVADQPGPGERGQGEERGRGVAAGRADDRGLLVAQGAERGAVELRAGRRRRRARRSGRGCSKPYQRG